LAFDSQIGSTSKKNLFLPVIRLKLRIILLLHPPIASNELKIFRLNSCLQSNNRYWYFLNKVYGDSYFVPAHQLGDLCKLLSLSFCGVHLDDLVLANFARVRGDTGAYHPSFPIERLGGDPSKGVVFSSHRSESAINAGLGANSKENPLIRIGVLPSESVSPLASSVPTKLCSSTNLYIHGMALFNSDLEFNGKDLFFSKRNLAILNHVDNWLIAKNSISTSTYRNDFLHPISLEEEAEVTSIKEAFTLMEERTIGLEFMDKEVLIKRQLFLRVFVDFSLSNRAKINPEILVDKALNADISLGVLDGICHSSLII